MQSTPNKSEDTDGRQDSTEKTKSLAARLFVNEETRHELLQWMIRAMNNKRILSKLDGSHSSVVLEHAWIFMFIDIIYVGTLFKISHLIGLCGTGTSVYILCASYFAIMFASRLQFDVYTCVSGASGILHVIAFCFYGMGVFVMTVNISSRLKSGATDDGNHSVNPGYGDISSNAVVGEITYGACERSIDYDTAFAVAFIFTRIVLGTMYGLYFYIFHESNLVGVAPDVEELGKDLRLSDLTRDGDAEDVKEFRRTISISSDHAPPDRAADRPTPTLGPIVNNPLQSHSNTAPATHRSSFVMRVTRAYGATATKLHFNRIFILKVAPVILSSLVMSMMFFEVSPVIVLPIVAIVEISGDFLPSMFIRHFADWKEMNPSRHFMEERLGLFFMLVLGEVVLGFSSVNYYSEDLSKIYKVIL